ncbi:MAG: aminoacyl-tRNA hydrolase [Candidatus Thioglobus sp.]|nr:aminoacyl-tRNA hydrolase [Candidatus Thioglobus sp.]
MPLKLLVGLGNPGQEYRSHRHNVGFWFCDALANLHAGEFKTTGKFFGETAKISLTNLSFHLLKPNTYMNNSGQSVQSLVKFYQLKLDEILVIHDDLDLSPGVAKLKFGGGHGGHNGLRDIIKALSSKDFYRLRLGIGAPVDREKVADFVLNSPSKSELELLQIALKNALNIIPEMLAGETDKAMKILNTKGKNGL